MTSKPKIIILITNSFPYGRASANFLRFFTYCISETGNSIEVLIPTGDSSSIKDNKVKKGNINGIAFTHLGFINRPKNILGKAADSLLGLFMLHYNLFKRLFIRKVDTIVVYNPISINFPILLGFKYIFKKELIVIISEYYSKPSLPIWKFKKIKWYIFKFNADYLYRFADKFIVFSEYLRNFIQSKFDQEKKILKIPNLIDPSLFTDSSNMEVFKQNTITIGYVGTPTVKDGIYDLILSFGVLNKKHQNTHLLIIGDVITGKSLLPGLKEFALQHKISINTITFKGFLPQNEVSVLLSKCQILALTRPSGVFAEAGFPTKLGEYFSLKKPVVVTRVGDMKHYFQHKVHVVFSNPGEIGTMVSAYEYLIKNPEEARKIGLNGYNWMLENLYYKSYIERINNFLD